MNTEEIQAKPPGEKSYNPTNCEKTYDHTGEKPYLLCSELDINSAKNYHRHNIITGWVPPTNHPHFNEGYGSSSPKSNHS